MSTQLKKEFQEKDVNRIRNLVNKKFGDKTVMSTGYTKERVVRVEGEQWDEDGKKWTIKKGIKQSITKLDDIKKTVLYPLLCPKCSSPMKTRQDKEMFNAYKTCMGCVVNLETKLRSEGKYDDYIKAIRIKNILAFADDYKSAMMEFINEKTMSFVTEQGDIESWDGKLDKQKAIDNIDKFIEGLKSNIDE